MVPKTRLGLDGYGVRRRRVGVSQPVASVSINTAGYGGRRHHEAVERARAALREAELVEEREIQNRKQALSNIVRRKGVEVPVRSKRPSAEPAVLAEVVDQVPRDILAPVAVAKRELAAAIAAYIQTERDIAAKDEEDTAIALLLLA